MFKPQMYDTTGTYSDWVESEMWETRLQKQVNDRYAEQMRELARKGYKESKPPPPFRVKEKQREENDTTGPYPLM
jgi:hypothetical protein